MVPKCGHRACIRGEQGGGNHGGAGKGGRARGSNVRRKQEASRKLRKREEKTGGGRESNQMHHRPQPMRPKECRCTQTTVGINTSNTIRPTCSQQHAESDWSQENPSHRHGPSRPPYPAKDTGKRTPRKIYCRERYRHIYRVITVSQVSCPIDQSPAVHTSHPMTKVVNAKPESKVTTSNKQHKNANTRTSSGSPTEAAQKRREEKYGLACEVIQ